MNRTAARLLPFLFALGLFAFVLAQTLGALHEAGVWRFGARPPHPPAADPLGDLDGLLARTQGETFAGASRDPFGYGGVTPRPGQDRIVPRRPVVPPPPALPELTAIIYDADPHALVRWEGREFRVRQGMLFAEFQVENISRDRVVLKRGSESIVLRRKPQGDRE